jgi:ribosomal-protein-alanine N-acetyltransferase
MIKFIKLSEVNNVCEFNRYIEDAAEIEKLSFNDYWTEKTLCELLSLSYYDILIAEANGVVVGYCCYSFLYNEAEILRIAITPHCRGKGYGLNIMEYILKLLCNSGIDSVFLEVRVCNFAAINLYEKSGFKKISVRKNYYSNGDDAVIYQKIFEREQVR